ncbi:hypothetical protein imdm_1337 [gamma proteobacterium IMCC2047]|nr:hypothetical protein imdm_1337 [gamma proteobacterium IMCC2047]
MGYTEFFFGAAGGVIIKTGWKAQITCQNLFYRAAYLIH